ncbi:putative VQ motif-containing protein 15/22 [Tanacetum coccineum]
MDSSNSGSYQSSSGGAADTEEYNSRTQSSLSSFLNNNNNNNNNHFNNLNNTFFNPTTSLNPVQDLSSLWTGTLHQQQSLHQQPVQPVQDRFTTFQQLPNSLPIDTNPKPGQTGREPGHHHMGVIKNPKKRTRASRRAPTTVLTTDTTNFRQMVQEFTGIPTGPFTGGGGGATLSRRLDLFRPSATKFQPVQVQHQPSFLNSLNNDNIHPSSINDFTKQPSSLVDMQNNPMLSFQSLLQTTMNNNNNQDSSNDLSGFASSSKRWSGENEKMENFEGVIVNNQNIGGSKINSGDQVQGNDQGSWICHSN